MPPNLRSRSYHELHETVQGSDSENCNLVEFTGGVRCKKNLRSWIARKFPARKRIKMTALKFMKGEHMKGVTKEQQSRAMELWSKELQHYEQYINASLKQEQMTAKEAHHKSKTESI